jgi:hypothetical protein
MAVTIYKSGKDMLAVDDHDMAAGRYLHFAAAAHRLDAIALDDDDGIFDRSPAGAVDQRPALDHEILRLRISGKYEAGSKQRQQRLLEHDFLPRPFVAGC